MMHGHTKIKFSEHLLSNTYVWKGSNRHQYILNKVKHSLSKKSSFPAENTGIKFVCGIGVH